VKGAAQDDSARCLVATGFFCVFWFRLSCDLWGTAISKRGDIVRKFLFAFLTERIQADTRDENEHCSYGTDFHRGLRWKQLQKQTTRGAMTHNVRVDAAAGFHSSIAGPVTMRNTLPPLASNDLFGAVMISRVVFRP
jgi:hypothetical protein